MSNLKQVKRHMGLEIWSHTNWDKSIADRVCKHSECSHWLANVKIRSCKCVGADWVPDLWTLSRLVGSRCVKSREQLVECSAPDTLSWRPPHSAPHTHTHTHTHTHSPGLGAQLLLLLLLLLLYQLEGGVCSPSRFLSGVSPWMSLFLSFNFLPYFIFFSSIQMCPLRCNKSYSDDSDSGQTDQHWMDFHSPVDGAPW